MKSRLFFILGIGILTIIAYYSLMAQMNFVESPIIEFTFVPPYGSYLNLEGRVRNVNPGDYKVAVYIFIEGAGWWTKPYFDPSLTPIQNDSTWVCDITTGGSDIYATQICAFLLPNGINPPIMDGKSELPETLYTISVANVCTKRTPKTISFSGHEWGIKASAGKVGPSSNYFSDSTENVWVDDEGQLHLKITQRNGNWYCSEIICEDSLGFGDYVFYVAGMIGQLDPNVVLGLFTWDNSPVEFHREIDIEFSNWGEETDTNAQYVIQPWDSPGNRYRWIIPQSQNSSTHSFEWNPDCIYFFSMNGHQPLPPVDSIIHSWHYAGSNVPSLGNQNTRINLWLFNGNSPTDTTGLEVIITKFEYFLRGNANGDKKVSISDIVYLINYLFKGGPPPNPLAAGDANCDFKVSVSDVVYLINYLFKSGPLPACCNQGN